LRGGLDGFAMPQPTLKSPRRTKAETFPQERNSRASIPRE
jgi:hypothetical protein